MTRGCGLDATRIVAIRHGQTAWNAVQRIQGHTDIPLDAVGRQQVERLARALADETFDAVYASDLARAHQTAAAIAGDAVQCDAGLRERALGAFEGLTPDEIAGRWPDQLQRWRQRDPDFAPDGGETLVEFSARCVGAADALARRHPGQCIALVAHGGVLDCLYRAATGVALQQPRSWALPNATINRLLHTGEGFTLVGWNDAAHLDDEFA